MTAPPQPSDRVYVHEDVYLNPRCASAYLANQGSTWPFDPASRSDLVGIFEQLRPLGRWPRAVNLWETDWGRLTAYLGEQFGPAATHGVTAASEPDRFTRWWLASSGERRGGWDRIMRPGPGSPSVHEIEGPPRPCVVQQIVRLRHGALDDYLAWFAAEVPVALQGAAWQPMMWLGALHDARAIVYFTAERWHGIGELATRLPWPDPAWGAVVASAALRPWEHSQYLHGGARTWE